MERRTQRCPLCSRRRTHTGAPRTLFYCYTHRPRCKQAQTSRQKRSAVTAGAAKHGTLRSACTPRPSRSRTGRRHRHAAACSSPPLSAASTSSLVSCAWMAVDAVAARARPPLMPCELSLTWDTPTAWAGERTGGRRGGAAHVVQRPGRHAVRGQGQLAHRGLQARLDVPATQRSSRKGHARRVRTLRGASLSSTRQPDASRGTEGRCGAEGQRWGGAGRWARARTGTRPCSWAPPGTRPAPHAHTATPPAHAPRARRSHHCRPRCRRRRQAAGTRAPS